MGRFTRPAVRLLGCSPSVADIALCVALVLFNVAVFMVYFEGWMGDGWSIDCADYGFYCKDAPIARASSYLVRLNMGLVWFPVCRNIWIVCGRTGGRGLLSYEQQVSLHRWLGYSVVAAVTVHLAGFWIQWFGQGMEVFLERALPAGETEFEPRPPVCESGICYGICGGGRMDGRGPCGDLRKKDCCHTAPWDGIAETLLPSTGEAACICPLEVCAGCSGLQEGYEEWGQHAVQSEDEEWEQYDVGLYNFYGELSWLAMVLMFLFGIKCCRRKHWDWFYWVHHLFVIAVIFGVLHDTNLLKVIAPGISVYVVDRLIRSRRTMHKATLLRANLLPAIGSVSDPSGASGDATERAVLHLSFATKAFGGAQGLRPGQHVQILCVGISEMQWHPYSIAAIWPPNDASGKLMHDQASFDVFIKDMGPGSWSARMCETVENAPDLATAIEQLGSISIEGPYGGHLPAGEGEGLEHPPASVLVAGGIGITPLASMLQSLSTTTSTNGDDSSAVHLWWSCRYEERMNALARALPALTDAAKALGPRLHVRLFVTGSPSPSGAHGEQPTESETSQLQRHVPVACEAQAGAAPAPLPAELSAALAVPPSLDRQRPQFSSLFEQLRQNMVVAATSGSGAKSSSDSSIAVPVHVCGPTSMMVRSMH